MSRLPLFALSCLIYAMMSGDLCAVATPSAVSVQKKVQLRGKILVEPQPTRPSIIKLIIEPGHGEEREPNRNGISSSTSSPEVTVDASGRFLVEVPEEDIRSVIGIDISNVEFRKFLPIDPVPLIIDGVADFGVFSVSYLTRLRIAVTNQAGEVGRSKTRFVVTQTTGMSDAEESFCASDVYSLVRDAEFRLCGGESYAIEVPESVVIDDVLRKANLVLPDDRSCKVVVVDRINDVRIKDEKLEALDLVELRISTRDFPVDIDGEYVECTNLNSGRIIHATGGAALEPHYLTGVGEGPLVVQIRDPRFQSLIILGLKSGDCWSGHLDGAARLTVDCGHLRLGSESPKLLIRPTRPRGVFAPVQFDIPASRIQSVDVMSGFGCYEVTLAGANGTRTIVPGLGTGAEYRLNIDAGSMIRVRILGDAPEGRQASVALLRGRTNRDPELVLRSILEMDAYYVARQSVPAKKTVEFNGVPMGDYSLVLLDADFDIIDSVRIKALSESESALELVLAFGR